MIHHILAIHVDKLLNQGIQKITAGTSIFAAIMQFRTDGISPNRLIFRNKPGRHHPV